MANPFKASRFTFQEAAEVSATVSLERFFAKKIKNAMPSRVRVVKDWLSLVRYDRVIKASGIKPIQIRYEVVTRYNCLTLGRLVLVFEF